MTTNVKPSKEYRYLETWNTKFGKSERVVTRRDGKFIDTISLTSLRKAPALPSK